MLFIFKYIIGINTRIQRSACLSEGDTQYEVTAEDMSVQEDEVKST